MTEFFQQIFNGLIIGSTYALVAIGLTIIVGLMRVLNYAHGEFYMLGGATAFYVISLLGVNFYTAAVLTIVAVFVFGIVIEKILVRKLYKASIVTTAIVTIGLSLFLQNAVYIIWGPIPQAIPSPFTSNPIEIGPFVFTPARLFAVLVTLIIIIITQLLIKYTKFGCAMRATFQERDSAALVGINISKIYSFTFAYGCVLAAIAGILLGTIFVVTPFMGGSVTNKAWAVSIVGGLGNIVGSIYGGLLLGVAETLGAGYISAAYKDVIGFILVILVLVFKPQGLFTKRND